MNNDFEQKRLDNILEQAEIDGTKIESNSKISALDPDFIAILFFVAIPFDIIFFILAIFDAFVIPWLLGMILSFIPFGIILIWHRMRTSNAAETKESVRKKIDQVKEEIEKRKNELMSAQASEKEIVKQAGEEAAKQISKETAKQAGKGAVKQAGEEATKQALKQTTKGTTKTAAVAVSKTAAKKGLFSLIGTSIPFIGAFPFYTLWVLSTLKEK